MRREKAILDLAAQIERLVDQAPLTAEQSNDLLAQLFRTSRAGRDLDGAA